MSKLKALLEADLDELRIELSEIKGRVEAAEERIRSDQEIVLEGSTDIKHINEKIRNTMAKIEAIEEDAKAYKVAAEGFLKGLNDDESKLNFASFCETLGIEIEIDADENAEANEEAEESDTLLSTGT